MIKYRLICAKRHEFEAWFSNAAACDRQLTRGLAACPRCGSSKVEKAIMAPAVAKRRSARPAVPSQPPAEPAATPSQQTAPDGADARLRAALRELHDTVRERSEYVGPRFAEEARKIHHGESDDRGIYGEASLGEARSLLEEGIAVLPLPPRPDDAN